MAAAQNSYYGLQLLESDDKSQWWVFAKWGRVGTGIGNSRLYDYDSAISEVQAKFVKGVLGENITHETKDELKTLLGEYKKLDKSAEEEVSRVKGEIKNRLDTAWAEDAAAAGIKSGALRFAWAQVSCCLE